MGRYDQVTSLEKLKQVVADESASATAAVGTGISLRAQRQFSAVLAWRLKAWRFPDPESIRYDTSEQDVVANDQLRPAHGKGARAIPHAAFTLALAQYCFDRDLPHPGFGAKPAPVTSVPSDFNESSASVTYSSV
ncbi:hypothetical protein AB4305_21330 [Nocardia sp. 2YAB30]|uniref:hypothetical protein n=1 Tax=unclassified Nocardia TaxID=2637762 RepID=UPI003F9DC9F9